MLETPKALTAGVDHIGLSVDDVEACAAFFIAVLGYERVGGKPAYPAIFISEGKTRLTLWQTDSNAREFDRRANVGLHHVALRMPSQEALDALAIVLAARPDVEIEFMPEPVGEAGNRHMMCSVPGGIRVEFVARGHCV